MAVAQTLADRESDWFATGMLGNEIDDVGPCQSLAMFVQRPLPDEPVIARQPLRPHDVRKIVGVTAPETDGQISR